MNLLETFINQVKNNESTPMNISFFDDPESQGTFICSFGNYVDGQIEICLNDYSELSKGNVEYLH